MFINDLYIYVAVFIIWIVALFLLLPKTENNQVVRRNTLVSVLGYDKVKEEAESVGWRLNTREFLAIMLLAIGLCAVISLFIHNFFFILVGFFLSFYAPRYVVIKIKKRRRMAVLKELPDNLKILTSKLIDFPSVPQAIAASLEDMSGQTKELFETVRNGLEIGIKPEVALYEAAQKVKLRKFYNYVEKLLMANSEGFHEEAINSLKESIEDMAFDIQNINSLDIKAKKEKKNFLAIVAGSWALPMIVSGLNSDNANIFLDTWFGQIFIVSFFVSTIYALVKGDDYLSLNLDEL